MPDNTAFIANNTNDPNYARKRALVDLQRLLGCMERDPSPSNISWHAIWMRAELASDLMESLRQNALPSDNFDDLGQRVERCSTQAKEIAMARKSQERDLVEEIFFRAPATPSKPTEEPASDQGSTHEEPPEVEERQQQQPPGVSASSSDHQRPLMSNHDLAQEQREHLEEEISLMAEQLKHSTLKMNSTLKSQSQHLGQMQELAEENVNKVGRAAENVQQHVSAGWRRTFFTWTLIAAIFGTFVFCIMTMKLVPKRPNACIPFLTCPERLRDDRWCRTLPDGQRHCVASEDRDRFHDTEDPVKLERRRQQEKEAKQQYYDEPKDSYHDDGAYEDSDYAATQDESTCGSGDGSDCDATKFLYGDEQEQDEEQNQPHMHTESRAAEEPGDKDDVTATEDEEPSCGSGDGSDCDATKFLYGDEQEEEEDQNCGSGDNSGCDATKFLYGHEQEEEQNQPHMDSESGVSTERQSTHDAPLCEEEDGCDATANLYGESGSVADEFDEPQDLAPMVEDEQSDENKEDRLPPVPEANRASPENVQQEEEDEPQTKEPHITEEYRQVKKEEESKIDDESSIVERRQKELVAKARREEVGRNDASRDAAVSKPEQPSAEDHQQGKEEIPEDEEQSSKEQNVESVAEKQAADASPNQSQEDATTKNDHAGATQPEVTVVDEEEPQQKQPDTKTTIEGKETDQVSRDAATPEPEQPTEEDQQQQDRREGQSTKMRSAETIPQKRAVEASSGQSRGADKTKNDIVDKTQVESDVAGAAAQHQPADGNPVQTRSSESKRVVTETQATRSESQGSNDRQQSGQQKVGEAKSSPASPANEAKNEPPKHPREKYPNISAQQIRSAASQCRLILLRKLIQRRPDLANEADANGFTPMHEAAVGGCTNELRYILDNVEGVDVNQQTWNAAKNQAGGTALWWTTDRGMADDHPVMQLLKERGAVIKGPTSEEPTNTVQEEADSTAAASEIVDEPINFSADDMRVASSRGELEALRSMLKRKPEWASEPDHNGWCALHEAVRSHQIEIVQEILDTGADINARVGPQRDGPTATAMAMESFGARDPLVRFLLGRGGHV